MRAAMALSQPGVNEKEINTLLTYLFNQEQGEGPAYDSIVAGGENALILHYINNNMTLKEGDLLLIDAGAQVNTYASDVTRTFPVNGKFTEAQAELYSLVLDSQKAAMAHMKIGNTLGSIHLETSKALATSLKDAGILSGSLDEIMETGSYRTYYPHGTGHWLGLDVHDESPYLIDEGNDTLSDVSLEEGMAFTCEPGLYFPADDKNVPSKWRGIGIRIEDDLIMNESGFTNITSSIPKEIKEVEEACQGDLKSILNKLETLPLMAK
jgi:Xaa-Pro aminopeptidase